MSTAPDPARTPALARFPVTTAQRQLWFMDQMAPGDPSLNIAVRWEVRGPVRAASLETAFRQVIERHEILRTRFAEENGEPVQELVDAPAFRLGVVDLRTTPEEQHAPRLDEIALADAAHPFDLTQPPLLRVTLVQLAPARAVLLITVHHIVFDGASIGVLGQEVGTLAAAAEAGTAADLPELPLHYGDFALWQEEYLASGVEAEDSAYWVGQMRGAPYFELPADKPRPALRPTSVARVSRALPGALIAALDATARTQEVTLFTLGAAACAAALHRATGAAEVLMSTPIAGRMDSDLDPLIGPFINTHVLRLPTDAGVRFDAHLAATRRVVEQAITHQALPFAKVVELVNPPRDPSRAPLASVAFSLMHVFHRDARFGGAGGFELLSRQSHTPGLAQDLHIALIGRPGGWTLNVEYCPDLFDATTAEALADSLTGTLRAVTKAPERTLGTLPLAPALAGRRTGDARPFARGEDVLSAHPEVAAAAVTEMEGGARYAFVSPRPDSLIPLETLPAELMGYAARRLPPDEMPAGVSVLAALPRTASGDVDRARLPRPVIAAPAVATPPIATAALSAPRGTPEPAAPMMPSPPPVAPGSAGIEARLAAIWAELLDHADPPRDASFFDLGGHSLLAVRLMARIRQAWDVQLSVAALYTAPTLTALAARLRDALLPDGDPEAPAPTPRVDAPPSYALPATDPPPEDDWRIEPLLTEGTAQPILSVNDVALTLDLAQAMEQPRRATCIRLFDGTRGIDHSPRSFEKIAAEYARVMRHAQPRGPYLLFGVCVHGNIALEAARILAAEGAEIAGVVLKDVWEPGYAAALKSDRAARWAERRFALANKIRMVRAGTMSLSAMLGSYRIIRRTGILQLAANLGLIDRVRTSDLAPEQERFVSYISAARNRYRPLPLDLPVLHVVTKITPSGRRFLPSIGWEKIVAPGKLRTVRLDEVIVKGGLSLGTAELAREVDAWLAGRSQG